MPAATCCCFSAGLEAPKVLVVGLQGSGKSLLVQQLLGAAAAWQPQQSSCRPGSKGRFGLRSVAVVPMPADSAQPALPAAAAKTMPTIGTELHKCPLGFTIREVGGVMRQLWHHYYAEASAVVFVVDAACPDPAAAAAKAGPCCIHAVAANGTAAAEAEPCAGAAAEVSAAEAGEAGDTSVVEPFSSGQAAESMAEQAAAHDCRTSVPGTMGSSDPVAVTAAEAAGAASTPATAADDGDSSEPAVHDTHICSSTSRDPAAQQVDCADGQHNSPCSGDDPDSAGGSGCSPVAQQGSQVHDSQQSQQSQHSQPKRESAGQDKPAYFGCQPSKRAAAPLAEVLQAVLGHADTKGKPLCIILNKTDQLDASQLEQQQQQQQIPAELLQCLHKHNNAQQVQEHAPEQPQQPQKQQQQQQQNLMQQLQAANYLRTSALTGAGMQSLLQWLACEAC